MNGQSRRRGVSTGSVAAIAGCGTLLVVFLVLVLRFAGHCGPAGPGDPVSAKPTGPAAEDAGVPDALRLSAAVTQTPLATPSPTPQAAPNAPRSFTLTAGGTVAMETEVVKSGYYSEAKAYDFDDVFALLRDDLQADVNLVTLENLVIPGSKVSKLNAPPEVMRMLRRGGFDTVALGFASSGERGAAGIHTTRSAALSAGLNPIGIYSDAADALPEARIREINGVRVALLHYTMNPTSAGKSKLKSDNAPGLMPLTSRAADDVTAARAAGAKVVIVSLHWGSLNASAPTKAQKQLAASLATAGADVLIGTGSRRVQAPEWLTATRSDGSQGRTLCLWSLGCLLTDSRKNEAVAGMLVHLTVTVDPTGGVTVDAAYTPTFAWRYDVAKVSRYQVVSTLRDAPDAMNSDQLSAFRKARERIESRLNGSPLFERMP